MNKRSIALVLATLATLTFLKFLVKDFYWMEYFWILFFIGGYASKRFIDWLWSE